jgi:LysM domain
MDRGEDFPMTARVAARTQLRLTRRGRIVLVLTVVLLVLIAGFTLGHGSSVAAGRSTTATQHAVIVRPGETLWSLAARIAPHQDPRLVVADIQSANDLGAAAVQPGQQLVVPSLD